MINVISGLGIDLTAAGSIGTQSNPIGLDSQDTVTTSSHGSTYLNSTGRVLEISGTTSGSYDIHAAGSVAGGSSGKADLKAGSLTIHADGSIGSEEEPLQVYVPGLLSGISGTEESHIQNLYTVPVYPSGGGQSEITVTATAGEHGTITPLGGTYETGDNAAFTFTPDAGYDVADVLVDGCSVGAVGSYTFENLSESHTLEVTFRACLLAGYHDLIPSAWYHALVDRVVERGLFRGTTGTTFNPGGTMTRAMFAAVLGRLAGIDPAASSAAGFKDVKADAWYGGYVAWASENGIILGRGDGTFGTADSITREQIVTLLYRYALYAGLAAETTGNIDPGTYSDWERVSAYARPAMRWAVETGLIQGNGGQLLPGDKATRVQAAVIVARFCARFSV